MRVGSVQRSAHLEANNTTSLKIAEALALGSDHKSTPFMLLGDCYMVNCKL
jgi:hypothetical protein